MARVTSLSRFMAVAPFSAIDDTPPVSSAMVRRVLNANVWFQRPSGPALPSFWAA